MGIETVKFFNRWEQGTAVDLLTRAVSYIPFISAFWLLATAAIFFLDQQDGLKIAITMTISISLHAVITTGLLKRGLGRYHKRLRPYIAYPKEIIPLGKKEIDTSFPSRHMSANLSLLTVVVYFHPTIIPIAIIWAILTALARLHNGMHYLSDVVAGAILGIVYGMLAIYFLNSYYYVLS